jgi:hypothetical protein
MVTTMKKLLIISFILSLFCSLANADTRTFNDAKCFLNETQCITSFAQTFVVTTAGNYDTYVIAGDGTTAHNVKPFILYETEFVDAQIVSSFGEIYTLSGTPKLLSSTLYLTPGIYAISANIRLPVKSKTGWFGKFMFASIASN